ncbi:unnamed protein product [Prunus armeniaca]|uniref:Uncharacterized protein n=1 Tax=Prunus armeniaca TaxID=36596 RepID=A0A6J5TF68_PRUAR|nr:unnamed protein product [Prunus armeniaca]
MSTGHLVPKGAPSTTGHPEQPVSEDTSDSKVTVDHQNSSSSSKSPEIRSSKNHAALKPKKEKRNKKRKKKSRSGNETKSISGNVFRIVGNKIEANKSKQVGVFGFGNTHKNKSTPVVEKPTRSPSEEEE